MPGGRTISLVMRHPLAYMRRMARRKVPALGHVLAMLALAAAWLPNHAAASCVVTQRAETRFVMGGGVPIVPVTVNGMPARFVLDTGAERSVVTREAVQRLGLALDEWVATTMQGVGGAERHRNALPRSLSLGGVALQRRTITRDTSLTVARLPPVTATPIDGLLGRDFLASFDLEIDFPAHTLRLHDVHGCSGAFLPAADRFQPIPVEMPANTALVVPVRLGGVMLRALLDTGANASLIAAPGMARIGLSPTAPADPEAAATVAGIGPATLRVGMRHFATMQVGPVTTTGVNLLVAPVHAVPIVDMLLGSDWMQGRRLWLSFATRQVFVAP